MQPRRRSLSNNQQFGNGNLKPQPIPQYVSITLRERRRKMEEAVNSGTMLEALCPESSAVGGQLVFPDLDGPIDDCGNTFLHLAVSQLDYSLVCVLLLKGASPNILNNSGTSPLRIAKLLRSTPIATVLREHGAVEDDLTDPDDIEPTGFNRHSFEDSDDNLNNIAAAAVSLKERRSQGNEASGFSGSATSTKSRLERRLRLAVDERWLENILRQYRASLNKPINILDAAYVGWSEFASFLATDPDKNLEQTDAYQATALMKAAYRGRRHVVEALLTNRANLETKDVFGYDALIWACFGGNKGCIELIIAVHQTLLPREKLLNTVYGNPSFPEVTPLIACVMSGNEESVEFLITLGSTVNQTVGKNKIDALTLATWLGWKQVINRLVNSGAVLRNDRENWVFQGLRTTQGFSENPLFDLANTYQRFPSLPNGETTKSAVDEILGFLKISADSSVYALNQQHGRATVLQIRRREAVKMIWGAQMMAKNTVISKYNPDTKTRLYKKVAHALNAKSLSKVYPDIYDLIQLFHYKGTSLDVMHMKVARSVFNLAAAAECGMKTDFIRLVSEIIQDTGAIVRMIDGWLECKDITSAEPVSILRENELLESERAFSSFFVQSLLLGEVRDTLKSAKINDVKLLIDATKLAIGAWPPPDAVFKMIQAAHRWSLVTKRLAMLANATGFWPVGCIEYSEMSLETRDRPLTKSLSYVSSGLDTVADFSSDYRKEAEANLIEKLAQQQQKVENLGSNSVKQNLTLPIDEDPDKIFFDSIKSAVQLFVQAVQTLKFNKEQGFKEEYVSNSAAICLRADTIILELRNHYLFKNIEETKNVEGNVEVTQNFQVQFQTLCDELQSRGKDINVKARLANGIWPPPDAAAAMINAALACAVSLKNLVKFAEEWAHILRKLQKERLINYEKTLCDYGDSDIGETLNQWEQSQLASLNPKEKLEPSEIPKSELTTEDLKIVEDNLSGIITEESNGLLIVKSGRLANFIDALTAYNRSISPEFLPAFFLTYQSFTNSIELFDTLIKRFYTKPSEILSGRAKDVFIMHKLRPIRLKVFSILKYWLENRPEDFIKNAELRFKFEDFLKYKTPKLLKQKAGGLIVRLESFKAIDPSKPFIRARIITSNPEQAPPKSLVPKSQDLSKILALPKGFLEIEPMEFARQLCLIDFESYSKIEPVEFFNQGWEKSDRLTRSPNITKMIKNTNNLSMWVASSILDAEDLKARLSIIKFILSVASCCQELRNFNSLTSLMAGFTMGPVYRMNRTWNTFREKLPKFAATYDEIMEITSAKGQFANYRKVLMNSTPPIVPFLGVYLTDLTFVELGNPDYMPETNFINFAKRQKLTSIIFEAQRYQERPFNFARVQPIFDFIESLSRRLWKNEKSLYEQSFVVEPKEPSIESDGSDGEDDN